MDRHAVTRALILLLALAGAARANQPPGPHTFVGTLGAVALLVALGSFVGAGEIRRAQGRASRPLPTAALALGLGCLFAVHEAGAALVCLALIALVLLRAATWVAWAVQARGAPPPPHLAQARPARLLAAAAALVLLAAPLASVGVALSGFWPSEFTDGLLLRKAVSEQLRWGLQHRDAEGHPTYLAPERVDGSLHFAFSSDRGGVTFPDRRTEFQLGPGARSFTLRVRPGRFPPWPWSLLVTQATWFADETGQLRALRVHDDATPCPPDAPVVATIEPRR